MAVEYLAEVGFKIDWQEVRNLPGADPVFIDNDEPNRGLNAKSSRYSGEEDYDLYIVFDAVVNDGVSGTNTAYRAISPALKANDYNEPSVSPRDFTATVVLKDMSGNVITGFIDTSTTVLMEVTWALVSGSIGDYAGAWAIHRFEPFGNTTYNIYELSSIRTNPTGIPLVAQSGETGVKVVYVGNNIITTCLIDGTLLVPGARYKLSCRLGLPDSFYNPPVIAIENITPDTDTGITEWDIAAASGAGSFGAADTFELLVYRSDTEELLETLTGNYGDDISAFTSDIGDSIKDYSSGTMDESTTIAFNKLAWATSKGFLNPEAVPLRFELTITEALSGQTSNTATGAFAIELQDAEYSGDLRYIATDNRKIYTGQAIAVADRAVALDITLKYSEELFAAPNAGLKGFAILGDSDFGTPLSELAIAEGQAGSPYQFLSTMNTVDGSAWTDTLLKSNIAGVSKLPNNVLIDDERTYNSEPVYWLGFEDSAAVAGNFLFMVYYDGAAWQAIDFTSLVSGFIAGAARVTASVSFTGDIYGLVDANNPANEHRVWRITQTTGVKTTFADFSNPANWTSRLMCGAGTSGTTDGAGAAAEFGEMFNMVVITDDGVRPLTMWVSDGGNHSIRLLTYNGGTDEYDVTTVIGLSGTSGSTNGTGTAARLNDPRGLCKAGLNAYIGEFGNKKIRKVVISSLAVTDFSGTGDNAYRVATLY
jgi:hypothetical protein